MFPLIIMAIEDENSKAFMTRLYLQYSRLIYSEIRKITGERDEEEDLLQTVVEKLMEKLPLLRGMEQTKLVNYIISTAENTTYNYLRDKNRRFCGRNRSSFPIRLPSRRNILSRRKTCLPWPGYGTAWMSEPSVFSVQSIC